LSPFFSLTNGYIVRVSAVDPTTGATVAAVVASDVSIAVDPQEENTAPDLPDETPWLVPLAT
jgi:hypothetical protein